MHVEAEWLPTNGKKIVVATDDRLCIGDFLQFALYLKFLTLYLC